MNRKYIFFLPVLMIALSVKAQSKDEREILSNSRLLNNTVFGTKDSATLEGLFAKELTYGHSGGSIQTRAEAIHGISNNKSTYTDTSLKSYSIIMGDDVAIVRYQFHETETKEGKPAPLNLGIMLVWVKERGKWKLFGRQAVKLQ
ncbi:MAG TPA: nuclear transport factor 2 family protein [Chitinophagaceae bacterium]|nr:nuclear transport factor 2 family protein [Chitinophagaceae bacterium]